MDALVLLALAMWGAALMGQITPAQQLRPDTAAPGERVAPEGSKPQDRRDLVIAERVRTALLAAKGVHANQITVETHEGRVHLKGSLAAPELISRAGRVTATVEGVRAVRNDIAIK